jgi:protein O-mannosyl-transferase
MRNRFLPLGAALAVFGASLGSGFHFDDYGIFSDPQLTSASGWMRIWGLTRLHPLADLSLWLNWLAGGGDPLGYHLLNLALALAAVWLAGEVFRGLLPERAAWAAALIFAVHPLQAETVNYVSARAALLGGALCLASLDSWVKGRRWIAAGWFAGAVLANEYSVLLPLLLFLLRYWPQVEEPKRHAGGPWALVTMTAMGVAGLARLAWVTAHSHAVVAPWKYLLAEGPAVWRYLRLLVFPYGFSIDPDIRIPAVWLGALAWMALAAAAVWLWRGGRRDWRVWALGGLLLLLPSSSLIPAREFYADSRMYLPMVAFAAAVGLLLGRVKTPAVAAGLAAVLAILSCVRTTVWMSDRSLWREAVSRAPLKARPKVQLSRSLPPLEALELLEKARTDAPHDATVPAEMGRILLAERQVDPALIHIGQALALDPNNAEYYKDRGVALGMSGLTEQARADFERALELDPNLTSARENLRSLPPAQ